MNFERQFYQRLDAESCDQRPSLDAVSISTQLPSLVSFLSPLTHLELR
ncbi:unnamed protein product [Brassica oleracea]